MAARDLRVYGADAGRRRSAELFITTRRFSSFGCTTEYSFLVNTRKLWSVGTIGSPKGPGTSRRQPLVR